MEWSCDASDWRVQQCFNSMAHAIQQDGGLQHEQQGVFFVRLMKPASARQIEEPPIVMLFQRTPNIREPLLQLAATAQDFTTHFLLDVTLVELNASHFQAVPRLRPVRQPDGSRPPHVALQLELPAHRALCAHCSTPIAPKPWGAARPCPRCLTTLYCNRKCLHADRLHRRRCNI